MTYDVITILYTTPIHAHATLHCTALHTPVFYHCSLKPLLALPAASFPMAKQLIEWLTDSDDESPSSQEMVPAKVWALTPFSLIIIIIIINLK